jgi:hypothetical protein
MDCGAAGAATLNMAMKANDTEKFGVAESRRLFP